ncbi:DNA replication/repair protein RecF [Foetidibacter luteolus]|uniref:DNA replication/repair protein RecF n=1 Tax=Foetidibacter luteolus TaxID=2608880 RepID=UPI00129BFD92|nr:DNA replication and repair protein RecF [Foetidibacter luteolus]
MLAFSQITLTQFRNYSLANFDFSERITGICGPNGSGKTNLLDAVHYLCFTKSYFSRPDATGVQQGAQGFRIEGRVQKAVTENKLVCILRETGRKEFYVDDDPYKKFSQHIGKYPCVMVAPDDISLITGPGEQRRNFADSILSQLYPDYLQALISYTKVLQQRNSLLKAAAEHNRLDEQLLLVMDEQLIQHGAIVYSYRKAFLADFIPLVKEQYNSIAMRDDVLDIVYDSQLHNQTFGSLLQDNRQRDIYLQRTGAGIHKDDLLIQMQQQPFKSIASQGQRKSLLFALKLAEYLVLKQMKGFAPLLLLDDVFEKLDEERMNNLLQKVCVEEDGQVLITDTHRERLEKAFTSLGVGYGLIEL